MSGGGHGHGHGVPGEHELEEAADKAFGRRVALTTAVYAVVLAIASLGANHALKAMLLAQQEATNQWAYYQAKVIREHLNRGNKMVFETQLAAPSSIPPAERPKIEALTKRFADEEQRMAADKKDIEKVAKKFEAVRDHGQTQDPYFHYAEVLLQIAIVAASVSIISGSRPLFGFSAVLAILGLVLTTNGYLLFFRIPFLHAH